MTATKNNADVRSAAAEALESTHSGDICVMWEGVNASHPTEIWGRSGWTSTPFQNADGGPMKVAGWLWSQGGCCTRIADLNSDGSATVYLVEFADESDEDEGVVAGQPVSVTKEEEVDAPETESEESDD